MAAMAEMWHALRPGRGKGHRGRDTADVLGWVWDGSAPRERGLADALRLSGGWTRASPVMALRRDASSLHGSFADAKERHRYARVIPERDTLFPCAPCEKPGSWCEGE
eukprot:gene32013-49973_t